VSGSSRRRCHRVDPPFEAAGLACEDLGVPEGVRAPDLDAAIAFASRIPVTRIGGTVEVRAMVER
jgi:hypothetical protein